MIEDTAIEAFNTRFTVDLSNYRKLTAAQRDQAKKYGSDAEALMKNRELALMIHHFKFELADTLTSINGHTSDDNARRIAISNQLTGIDSFVASLRRAVIVKNRILDWERDPANLNQ